MKINQSSPSTVLFSSLKVGDIFGYNGNIYMKTPKITTMFTYNTYNFSENDYTYFSGSDEVTPYPNATLNLT